MSKVSIVIHAAVRNFLTSGTSQSNVLTVLTVMSAYIGVIAVEQSIFTARAGNFIQMNRTIARNGFS